MPSFAHICILRVRVSLFRFFFSVASRTKLSDYHSNIIITLLAYNLNFAIETVLSLSFFLVDFLVQFAKNIYLHIYRIYIEYIRIEYFLLGSSPGCSVHNFLHTFREYIFKVSELCFRARHTHRNFY